MLIRLHPNVASLAEEFIQRSKVVDVTDYTDPQELLAASDVLVTDYSSIMFDFMLTGRPCFQYASDIAAYRNDRDFYFALDQLPFPLAEDNDHLEQINEQISREPRKLPKLIINPDVKDIRDFKYEDFQIVDYDPWPAIKGKVSV